MEIPNFKSEGQRQSYWKKQRMIELQLDEQNEQKLSKAYHDVDFGVIPAARDNRSIKEIEQDTTLQMINAKKNAMTLMKNDGAEADKLLDLIGKRDYATFNRFAPDIIEKLRNQIGRISAIEAMKEIGLHFAMQLDPYRRVPPSADQIDNLIMTIDSRFTRSNTMVRDILQRLEAYAFVVGRGPIPPDVDIPMSAEDVEESISILDEIDNDEEALASLEEKSVGITLESNASLLEEISTAAESKGTPAEEETKGVPMGEPTGQPKGDEPEVDDDEPFGPPLDDENNDDDDTPVQSQPKFIGDIEKIRATDRRAGMFFSMEDIEDALPGQRTTVRMDVEDLMEFIGKSYNPTMSLDELQTVYYTNKSAIANKIHQIEQMESKSNVPTGGLDEAGIMARLSDYNVPNVGRGATRHTANLYLEYLPQLKAEAEAAVTSKVTITRGGMDEIFNSANESWKKYRLIKNIARKINAKSSTAFTYTRLQAELNNPIYQQTADLIIERGWHKKTVGSGVGGRKGRRGRRR
jgi:hypothetical protein